MTELSGERVRILAELAERAWADHRLKTETEDRLAAERSAAVSEERLSALGVTAERRREAALWIARWKDQDVSALQLRNHPGRVRGTRTGRTCRPHGVCRG